MSEKIKRHKRKEKTGIIVSDKMNKTRIVQIISVAKHRKYSRSIIKKIKFKVHDEQNQAKLGDKVKIMETRPISKDKRWRLVQVLEKAGQ